MDSVLSSSKSSSARQSGSSKAYIVCFSSALFFFYEFIQMQMFNTINESLRTAFSANATQISFLSSTFLWGDLIFLLPAGVLLDRYSTRKTIIYSMLLCIVSTFGFAMTSNVWIAAFWHFTAGIGNAFCFLACIILVARWFPSNKQAMVIGMVITIAFLGGMVAQAPLASAALHLGWRKALWVDAVLGVLILLQIMKFVEDSPSAYIYKNPKSDTSVISELRQVIKNKQNYMIGLYTSLLNLPIMVLCALWGAESLKTLHSVSTLQASSIVSMILVGSIIGCPFAGWLSDTMGYRRKPMIWGAALSLITISYLMLGQNLGVKSLSVIFFLIGFFTSTQVIAYPMVAESNNPKLTATATGLASLIIMGGAAIGQLLFGEMLDRHWQGGLVDGFRSYMPADYHFAMMLFPIAFIIGLVAILFSKETYCSRTEHV